MVSSFRHYLNSDPQFEGLRACYPVSSRYPQARTTHLTTGGDQNGDGEGDFDMADDNDDYEGMNGGQAEGTGAVHPPPPPPPTHTAPIGLLPSDVHFITPGQTIQAQLPAANFSTWLNSHQADGDTAQASFAPIGSAAGNSQQQADEAETNGTQVNGGASTAPLYNYFTPPQDQDQQGSHQN